MHDQLKAYTWRTTRGLILACALWLTSFVMAVELRFVVQRAKKCQFGMQLREFVVVELGRSPFRCLWAFISCLHKVYNVCFVLEVEHASKLYSDRFRMSMQKTRSPILDEIREFTKVWTLLQHITFFTSWPPALLKDCWPLWFWSPGCLRFRASTRSACNEKMPRKNSDIALWLWP